MDGVNPLRLGPGFIAWTPTEPAPRNINLCELLSTIGFIITSTSPIRPNKDGLPPHGLNYCLPLIAMYGRWCLNLCVDAGSWDKVAPPTQVAISYVYRQKSLEKIVLGACRAGSLSNRNKSLVNAFRKDTIMNDIWPAQATTPAPLNNGISSWINWGHCAETVSAIFLILNSFRDLLYFIIDFKVNLGNALANVTN